MPTVKTLPSPCALRELLRYEQETGTLFWRARGPELFSDGAYSKLRAAKMWNAKHAGQPAFTAQHRMGYLRGRISGQDFLAHRVIWAIATGEHPVGDIDHVNGNTSDNKIANLRDVTHIENCRNMRRNTRNQSGATGVCWHAGAQKWMAFTHASGKTHYLGVFAEKADAITARTVADRSLGFHPNHGRGA